MKAAKKRLRASLLPGLLVFLFLLSYASRAGAQAPGTFTPTGSMNAYRAGHTANLLLNGKVLIAGGDDGHAGNSRSAELYDPVTGTFTPTGDMTRARSWHSATLLPDGRVLIIGGGDPSAELYDPTTGTFATTAVLPAGFSEGATATSLNDGRVLLSGGGVECGCYCAILNTPEVYDPATGTVTVTGDYVDKTGGPYFGGDPYFGDGGLFGAPTVLLPDGKVLIAGEPVAELYDPATGTFRFIGQMTSQSTYSIGGAPTLLTNGRVLLTGGEFFEDDWLADAELYDPLTAQFTAIPKMKGVRSGHTATLLRDGTVLIAGGDHTCTFIIPGGFDVLSCDAAATGTEIYDPATGTFNAGPKMTWYRVSHTATLLMDGRILIAGGYTDMRGFWPTNSAELYVPSVLVPAQIVTDLRFDRTSAVAGSSYSVNVSGSNLTPQTFFDVRFTSPGSTASDVVLNWQQGVAESHLIPAGLASGAWTINGVRAHEVETDHTGSFLPVSATITVAP